MSLTQLHSLLPPPAHTVGVPLSADWQEVESALGTKLPSDYKQVLASYGCGRIDDFLDIFIPGSSEEWNNLLDRLAEQRELFAAMQRGSYPLSYDLHPATPGLLPVGQTDNGDMLFYLVDGDAEDWKVALLPSRGRDVEVYDGGLSSFLVAALRHEVDAFPEDFARPAATFTPAK